MVSVKLQENYAVFMSSQSKADKFLVLHLNFHCLIVVKVLFCSLTKGITLRVLFNLLCVWISHKEISVKDNSPTKRSR